MDYVCWEILQRLRTAAGEPKPAVSLSPLVHGLFAWPIMVPEALEYALAELGVLLPPPSDPAKGIAELGAPPNGGPTARVGNSGVTEGPPSVS